MRRGVSVGDAAAAATQRRQCRANYSADCRIPAFELDLFGRLRSLTRADSERYFATEAAARATRLALVGDIATPGSPMPPTRACSPSPSRPAQRRKKRQADPRRGSRAGSRRAPICSRREQVLETAPSPTSRSSAPRVAQDVNLLQLLVGAPVDPALLPASIERGRRRRSPRCPPGSIPRVLLRRPDVVQAEYQLHAANAEIGAARAALFPTHLADRPARARQQRADRPVQRRRVQPGRPAPMPIIRSSAPAPAAPASRRPRRSATPRSRATRRAIQTAFREVADALADRGTIGEQLRAATANVAATTETLTLVTARYRGGIDPYLTTLDAQRSQYRRKGPGSRSSSRRLGTPLPCTGALGADPLIAQTPFG